MYISVVQIWQLETLLREMVSASAPPEKLNMASASLARTMLPSSYRGPFQRRFKKTVDFVHELLATHGVSDLTYQAAIARWGERGVVELTALVGYFVMVSWLMNVARTPAQAGAVAGIDAFPQ